MLRLDLTVLSSLIAQGYVDENGHLTSRGELYLHQLKQLEYWSKVEEAQLKQRAIEQQDRAKAKSMGLSYKEFLALEHMSLEQLQSLLEVV